MRLRRLIAKVLRGHGYKVIEAGDGIEALELIERGDHTFHLVVTDVVMPGIDGCTLAEKLSRVCPGTKVLMISGYLGSPLVQDAMSGPTHFLEKPFTPAQLCKKVRDTLDESHDARSARSSPAISEQGGGHVPRKHVRDYHDER